MQYDQFRARIEAIVEMPNQTIDLLFRFVHHHGGTLSKRARQNDFSLLTEEEVSAVEAAYRESFGSN